MPDDDDKDKTPVEPIIKRKSGEVRLGDVPCPNCRQGTTVLLDKLPCVLCGDNATRTVPLSIALKWGQGPK
jgi:hypothetical protein